MATMIPLACILCSYFLLACTVWQTQIRISPFDRNPQMRSHNKLLFSKSIESPKQDRRWSLPSQLAENPMAWMLDVNGFIVGNDSLTQVCTKRQHSTLSLQSTRRGQNL